MRLANEIPGFGGMFINSSHELVTYVKDTTTLGTQATFAVQALRAHLSSDGFGLPQRIRPSTVRAQRADYDWQTLSSYRDFIADSLMGADAVVIVAIDVVNNRVSATVASTGAGAESKLTAALSRHQIPLAAIEISRGSAARSAVASAPSVAKLPFAAPLPPRTSMLTLTDSEPALMGGIMIRMPATFNNSFCSIGAVVDSAGTKKLLSASHCSRTIWNLQGDSVKTFGVDLIGHETTDKTATTACCVWPSLTFWHRGSDAALWSMDAPYGDSNAVPGVIARTTSRDSSGFGGALHRSLNTSSPYLYIYDTLTSSSLVVGMEIDKVGYRSGWQHGKLVNTCVDYFIGNTEDHECVSEVTAMTITGDSGGPVFIWDGSDGAVLVGIQAALNQSNLYTHDDTSSVVGFFSNWSAIVTENGPIDPIRHITVGSPDDVSGSVSGGNGLASWSAVSTTNTTGSTYYQIYQTIWDASTQSYVEFNQYVGSTTGTYAPVWAPWSLYDTGYTDGCSSSTSIYVVAYNSGVVSPGGSASFIGPANGPPGCLASRLVPRRPGARNGKP